MWGSPIPAVTGGGLGFFTYLAGQGGVGAHSSSSKNQQPPQQQERVQGETR
jgi:hypothetical protein